MKNKGKTLRTGLLGAVMGVAATLVGRPIVTCAMDYFGPPRVTIMNATGNEISDVTVSLRAVKRRVPDLKDGQAVTVSIAGRFAPCSTHVSWTDSMGRHEGRADDYVQNYGFCHARVVLTPDRKVRAIYEIAESSNGDPAR